MKNRILPLLLAAALLLPLLAAPASAAGPAPLELTCTLEGQSAAVTVVTTGAVTLSNYDIQLSWDSAVLTLTGISNGQESLFPIFQANIKPGDPGAGKIAALTRGANVTVAAGETLAVYRFTLAGSAAAGSYGFTLTVLDAAQEDGKPLAWIGESVSGSLEVSGETAVPLQLDCMADGADVTVALVTAEAVTLSNYDVQLSWDGAVFTLTGISNGQESLFPNFQTNTKPGDPGAGKISAASGGADVTVAAGETLASYSFTLTDGADVTAPFTLTVREAADQEGLSFAWKGASVSGKVVPPPEIEELQTDGTEITVCATCDREEAILYLASYTAEGRMIEIFAVPVEAGTTEYSFTLTEPGGYVKAFLTDEDVKPLCQMLSSK